MKILVANLGSTSFKYRLFDMAANRQLARGGIERIGSPESKCAVEIDGRKQEKTLRVPDHAEAVRQCLAQLTDAETGCLKSAGEVSAIAFKAVHGGRITGVQRVDADVLAAMEEMNTVVPAHNPPYIAAMRQFMEKLPEIPLVAAFETDFHQIHSRAQPLFRGADGMGRRLADPPLRFSRREPPLHRHANGGTARPERSADHLLPPGRIEFAVRHPQWKKHGDEHGLSARKAACRRTTASATSIPSCCRRSCKKPAKRWKKCSTCWPTSAACWA